MKNKLFYSNFIASLKYIAPILAVLVLVALLMIIDETIIRDKSLEYSVYVYEEAGIKLPHAAIKYETDMVYFTPLYLHKKSLEKNFGYFNLIEKSRDIWLSITITREHFDNHVLIVYTDNAFMTSAYLINKNNKNVLQEKDFNSIVLENTNRKIVFDFTSKLDEEQYNIYLMLTGDISNIKVYSYDTNKFVKFQETAFLLIGIWIGFLLMTIASVSRILDKKDVRKVIAFIFIIFYVFVYFGILIARSGLIALHSLHLQYVEAVWMVLPGCFVFCVLKLLISSHINIEWLRFSLLFVSTLLLLVFSGYSFIAEVFSVTLMMLLFLITLYYNHTFKYITETAKKYGLVIQLICVAFLFVNLLAFFFNRSFTFNLRFLHYGLLVSLLLAMLKNYETFHYNQVNKHVLVVTEKVSVKEKQLEKELQHRLKVIQGLLCKPLSEILIMLDEIIAHTTDDRIKRFANIWKLELGYYLPHAALYAIVENNKSKEYINLNRLLQNVKTNLQYFERNINLVYKTIKNIDVFIDQEAVEWLFIKAILFAHTMSGSLDITINLLEAKPTVIIEVFAKMIHGNSEKINNESKEIYEEELRSIAKYANVELDVYINEELINISIKFNDTINASSNLTVIETASRHNEISGTEHDTGKRKIKILIVEDDPIMLYEIKRNLEKIGYDVQAVISGYRGLDYLKNYGNARIVLLSDSILDIAWNEFIKEMSENKKKHVPVIVVTSTTRHDTIDMVFKAGADDFITKPVNIYELAARIKMHIQINESIEKQLESQQKIAELDKLKSLAWLTAGIAHEINTPNNAVLRNVPIIRSIGERLIKEIDTMGFKSNEQFSGGFTYDDVKNEFPSMLNDIYMSAIQIGKIIEDLRLYVRSGGVQTFKPININNVVEYALRLLNHTIKNGTNNFITELEQNIPEIKGDAMKIVQVIVNLIENAIHALPDKNKGIMLKTSTESSNEKVYVVLTVEDEGCGISDEDLPFIFDPFFTTRREMGGTGLGLPVVYGITQEHNAEISVETSKEKGTKFKIIFPALKEDDNYG